MAGHVVTAGCVVARTRDGGEAYFYAGAILPETVSAAEKTRLAEVGLVAAIEVAEGPDGDEYLAAIVGEQPVDDDDDIEVVDAEPGSVLKAPARRSRGRR